MNGLRGFLPPRHGVAAPRPSAKNVNEPTV